MNAPFRATIVATGSYVPEQVITTDLIAAMLNAVNERQVKPAIYIKNTRIEEHRITPPGFPLARSVPALVYVRKKMAGEGYVFKHDRADVYALIRETLAVIGAAPGWFDKISASPLVTAEIERARALEAEAKLDGFDPLVYCAQKGLDAAACDSVHIPRTHGTDMGAIAAQRCLEKAGLSYDRVTCLYSSTSTPLNQCPGNGVQIDRLLTPAMTQAERLARRKSIHDGDVGCCGFMDTFENAVAMIESGRHEYVLVVASEHMSTVVKDHLAQMFGDGAGAVLLGRAGQSDSSGVLAYASSSACDTSALVYAGSGTEYPASDIAVRLDKNWLHMDGEAVKPFAQAAVRNKTLAVCEQAGIPLSEVKLIVPHQMNGRILAVAFGPEGLNWPMDKVMLTLPKYGNMTAASVPFALDMAIQEGRAKKGDLVVLVAMGIGLKEAAALVRL